MPKEKLMAKKEITTLYTVKLPRVERDWGLAAVRVKLDNGKKAATAILKPEDASSFATDLTRAAKQMQNVQTRRSKDHEPPTLA